jgi:hypothetical protein
MLNHMSSSSNILGSIPGFVAGNILLVHRRSHFGHKYGAEKKCNQVGDWATRIFGLGSSLITKSHHRCAAAACLRKVLLHSSV